MNDFTPDEQHEARKINYLLKRKKGYKVYVRK